MLYSSLRLDFSILAENMSPFVNIHDKGHICCLFYYHQSRVSLPSVNQPSEAALWRPYNQSTCLSIIGAFILLMYLFNSANKDVCFVSDIFARYIS